MDERIRAALAAGQVIDITTVGRRSGEPRRIEIVYHVIDGRIFISGTPRPGHTRAWIHNLVSDPHLTFHLKGPVRADLPATARVVTDEEERRRIMTWITTHAWKNQDLETMVDASPLIEVTLEDQAA